MRDIRRTFCIFYFLYFLDTLFLYCDSKPCTHFWCVYIYIYIYIEVVITVSPISSYVVSFFSLCTCFLLIVYFCFTLRCRDEFCLKCFRNTGFQSFSCHILSSCKVFQELCYDRFYCIQQVSKVEWFMTSLICSFVCCGFVTDCQMERLLGHMWIMLGTYVNAELANPSFNKTHFICNWVDLECV